MSGTHQPTRLSRPSDSGRFYFRAQRKRLRKYSFFEASPLFINAGLTSAAELNQPLISLAAVAADETIAVAQTRMPVTWARKLGASD